MPASRRDSLLVLPGLGSGRSAIVLSAVLLGVIFVSRVALLPDGPWEQDEALFAAGVLDFDVTRHRPHPPGFVGWIALGTLLYPLVGDPVFALQLASALASVVLFAALAHALARLTQGPTATLAAAAFSLSPLVWVHAGRAFSTTPALACAVAAIVAWPRGPRVHRLGWVLLACAATIRPQLLPELCVLALLGLTDPGSDRATKLQGVTLALGVVVLATLAVLYGGGPSPSAVARAFADHFGRHRGGLDRTVSFASLGLVRGLGHPAVALAVLAAAAVGCVRALRTNRTQGLWLLALMAVTAAAILRLHHPGFPRYAVALLAALLPAAALGLDALGTRWSRVVCSVAIAVGSVASLGPLFSMQDAPLPPVAAARRALQDPNITALAYSHGVFSFARLEAEQAGVTTVDVGDPAVPVRLPAGAYAIEGRTLHFLDGVTACTYDLPGASARAMTLGQRRFDRARLGRDVVVLGDGVFRPERDVDTERFAWLGPGAQFHVPAGATALQLRLTVPDTGAPQPITATTTQGPQAARTLMEGPGALAVPLSDCTSGCTVSLTLEKVWHEVGDPRSLTARLDAAWAEGPAFHPAYGRWSPGEPRSLRAHDVQLDGVEAPETFGGGRRGAWTGPRVHARFPASAGTLEVELARPDHVPGLVQLRTGAEAQTLEIGPKRTTVTLKTDAPGGIADLWIDTPTFVPAEVRDGTDDRRTLGLILYGVTSRPANDPCGPQ
ncbi:MAG: hypothetical protein AAGA54_30995 [Myxococcota bacterium]